MPKAIKYYKVIFPNNVIKHFNNVSRQEFCRLLEEDKDNLCIRCQKRKAILGAEFDRHTGRYHNYNIIQNGISYKVLDISGKWCRGCQIYNTSVANLMSGQSNIDYERRAEKKKEFDNTEEGYIARAEGNRTQIKNKFKEDTKINFYYAEIYEDPTVYKIGTCFNLDTRLHKSKTKLYHDKYTLKNISLIRYDDFRLIADLEYYEKINYGIRNFELGTEFIQKEDLSKVLNFANNYK